MLQLAAGRGDWRSQGGQAAGEGGGIREAPWAPGHTETSTAIDPVRAGAPIPVPFSRGLELQREFLETLKNVLERDLGMCGGHSSCARL